MARPPTGLELSPLLPAGPTPPGGRTSSQCYSALRGLVLTPACITADTLSCSAECKKLAAAEVEKGIDQECFDSYCKLFITGGASRADWWAGPGTHGACLPPPGRTCPCLGTLSSCLGV
jgi:hypothetical protein